MTEKKPLLDGMQTSYDWQKKAATICVLPVGAFEQHSRHLPLASDNIQADYFGAFVARELGPVVRDINRHNQRLKILLVDWWVFADRDILDVPRIGKLDMHAGEFETSVMMVLRPALVRTGGIDMEPVVEGFQQADLNTFGMGYNAPEGAYGFPSLASREKGEKLVATIKMNMMKHIRKHLAWLDKNRTYSGKELDER